MLYLLLTAALAQSPSKAQQIASITVGMINSVTGKVIIEREGKPFAAKVGSPVTPTDVVETAAGAEAKIVMKDRTVLVVLPKTRFAVKNYSLKTPSQRALQLLEGKLKVTVEKFADPKDSFEILTPIATVGVRGTEFSVEHKNDRTDLSVESGKVEMSSPEHKAIEIGAGARAFVTKTAQGISAPTLSGQK